MNVVYNWIPSKWDELYYSIQSVKRHIKDLDKIYVLTTDTLPFTDDRVIRVYMEPFGSTRERVLVNNIARFCLSGVCDRFIYMCDDFFVMRDFTYDDLLPVYAHSLEGVAKAGETNYWKQTLYNAYKALKDLGYPTYAYTTHSPVAVKCDLFMRSYNLLKHTDYQWETGYFNTFVENPVCLDTLDDYTIYFVAPVSLRTIELITEKVRFFSISEEALNEDMKFFLKKTYKKVENFAK